MSLSIDVILAKKELILLVFTAVDVRWRFCYVLCVMVIKCRGESVVFDVCK